MSELQSINLFEHRRNRALNMAQTWLLGAGSLLLLGVTAWAFAGSTGNLWYAFHVGGAAHQPADGAVHV